jgi:hypothetical protein
MLTSADARRRWLGMVCLGLAAGLLIWGQTVLKPHLEGILYLAYWALCFLLTICAVVIALWDVRVLRNRTRREHRALIERTLEEVEEQRPPRKKNGEP